MTFGKMHSAKWHSANRLSAICPDPGWGHSWSPDHGWRTILGKKTGCKIDGRKVTASLALIAPLVWQISRKNEREAKKASPSAVGRGLINLDRSTCKFDLGRSCWVPIDASWPREQFDTIYKSLAPSFRDLFAEKLLMTSHDLRWPCQVSLTIFGNCVIADQLVCHISVRIGWFWLVYSKQDAFNWFPIVKITTLAWPQVTDVKTMRHKLHILVLWWIPEGKKSFHKKTLALTWLQTFLR